MSKTSSNDTGSLFSRLFASPAYETGLEYWRYKIFLSLSKAFVIFGLLAYIPSMYLSVIQKLWPVAILDSVVYFLILSVFFLKKISFRIRAAILLCILYVLGMTLLFLLGPVGAGLIYLFAFPVLASVLLGFRASLYFIAINLFSLTVWGFLMEHPLLKDYLIASYDLGSWIIISVNFICLNIMTAVPIAVLVRGLENTIAEEKRTKTLLKEEQGRLAAKNEELLKINADMDNFIYTASHDLRSPLSNMEGLVNILQESLKENSNVTPALGMIKKSVHKLQNTINDLTEISKIQRVDSGEDMENVLISELFEDVKYSLESLIQKYSPIITTDFSVHEIYFSRKNLRSLFYNILSNAIKYSSPDRVNEITIATKAEGNYTVLSIADKGLGMSEGYENKIFRMFKRLHDHVEGSGVGLYLVKRIIENSGGKIEVESALGKGSCFRLFFRKNPGKA